jgi:hypothetical protein
MTVTGLVVVAPSGVRNAAYCITRTIRIARWRVVKAAGRRPPSDLT